VSADTLTPAEAPFTEALQRALAALDDITRTQTADTGTYTYRYADLGTILGAVRPRLAEHGLAVVQLVSSDLDRGAVLVSTQLRHCSGITYLRRYSVLALLGLATEDDDGAAASTGPVAPRYDEQRSETPEERLRASAGALFSALGLEPQQRLDRMAAILGRDVDSWGELSLIEQRRIVEQLQADRHG
jgi:hypothetical protein